MSSESDNLRNSSEEESGKKQLTAVEGVEKRIRTAEDQSIRFHPPVNAHPPHPMMYRHGMEGMMMRPPMPRPMSPRTTHTEDSDLTDAMIFLNRIKEEYGENLHVYDSFLETMRDFRFEKIDAEEVCKAVRILFKEKPHLIRLFDEYLPHHLRYPDRYGMQGGERQKMYRTHGFIHRPPTPIMMGQVGMHMGRMGMPGHPTFIGRPMRQSPPPMGEARSKTGPIPAGGPKLTTAPREFVHDVKKRYQNKPLIYRQFLDILQNPNSSFEKLYTQVSALLCDSPDLIEKFEKTFRTGGTGQTEPVYTCDSDPLKKIKQRLAEQGNLGRFLKIINFYNQDYLQAEEVVELMQPLIEDEESMASFKAFIKYQDAVVEEGARPANMARVGSYRIYPVAVDITTSSALPKEVLNFSCISVSTHDSEDDTYVFRNKNNSEELLTRIVEERSEADLAMDRLKFLIIRFEELYETAGDAELDLEDIRMSSALVRETLSMVYDGRSTEILEAVLSNPKKSLPVVLKRLNKVFRENLERVRDFKKFWREMVEEHYYKAYDTKGVLHRAQEKNYLSMRYIQSDAATPCSFKIDDHDLFVTIRSLFELYVSAQSANGSRKPPSASQMSILDSVFDDLRSQSLTKEVDFDTYAVFYYVLAVYTRFSEIKKLKLPPITSNPVAVSIGLQEEACIEDRYTKVVKAAEDLMNKAIDADFFEEVVRRMTDSMGYKLYNLKKMISKIEKHVNLLVEGRSSQEEENENSYSIKKSGNDVFIKMVEKKEDLKEEIAVN